jgi:hypothetical protein
VSPPRRSTRKHRLVIGPAVTEVTKFKVKEPARVDIPRGGVHQVYKQCLGHQCERGGRVPGAGPLGMLRGKGTILRPVHAVSSGEIPLTGGFLWVIEECACNLARSKLSSSATWDSTASTPPQEGWPLGGSRRPIVLYPRSPVAVSISCRHRVGRLTLNFRNNGCALRGTFFSCKQCSRSGNYIFCTCLRIIVVLTGQDGQA